MQTNPLGRAFESPVHHIANASAFTTSFLGALSYFTPSEWMIIGIMVGVVCTVLGLIVSTYVKIASFLEYRRRMRSDIYQETQRPDRMP